LKTIFAKKKKCFVTLVTLERLNRLHIIRCSVYANVDGITVRRTLYSDTVYNLWYCDGGGGGIKGELLSFHRSGRNIWTSVATP
jgi:hypothetical protein